MHGLRRTITKIATGPTARAHPFATTVPNMKRMIPSRAKQQYLLQRGNLRPGLRQPNQVVMRDKLDPTQYVLVAPEDSVSMPAQDNEVKVVGWNTIAPVAQNPNFREFRGKVKKPTFTEPNEGEGVEILPQDPRYPVDIAWRNFPGMPSEKGAPDDWHPQGFLRQQFPDELWSTGPGKLNFRTDASDRLPFVERQRFRRMYAQQGSAQGRMFPGWQYSKEKPTMLGLSKGNAVAPDDLQMDDVGFIDVIASIASAAATGYKAYADIKNSKEAARTARRQAAADAAAVAAQYEMQLRAQMAQTQPNPAVSYQPGAPGIPPGPGIAPTQTGTNWTTIALVGGGVLLVGAVAVLLLRR